MAAVVRWVAVAAVEDGNLLHFELNNYTIKKLGENTFRPACDKNMFLVFLLNWHIRSAHISYTNIFTVSFFKQAHIIPGINRGICRVNYFKITDLYNLVPII